MKKNLLFLAVVSLLSISSVCKAQVFSDDDWEDQKTMVMAKWSPLYYELNVGINVNNSRYSDGADFVYFSLGYGKPTTKNSWKNILPTQQAPNDSGMSTGRPSQNSGSQQTPPSNGGGDMPEGDTSGLHAGTIGIGWQHFFNHVIGFHVQAGWGFIANFGGNNAPSEPSAPSSRASSSMQEPEAGEQKTFIYNSVPVQAGLDLNLWTNLNLQVGVTYMWKGNPVPTIGLGVAF